MFTQTFARAAICIALAGPSLAGDNPLDRVASDVLEGIRGAPENARLDGYRRLRDADDPIAEAVWKVSNARLRPAGRGALWPAEASERYHVRDCVETPRTRITAPVIGLPRAATTNFHSADARYTAARESSAPSIVLIFGPVSGAALEARASAGGEVEFGGSFLMDAEVASEVVLLRPEGIEVLPGAEPEGTLGRLVPDLNSRTIRIEGAARFAGTAMSLAGICPQMRLTAHFGAGLPARTHICRISTSSGSC